MTVECLLLDVVSLNADQSVSCQSILRTYLNYVNKIHFVFENHYSDHMSFYGEACNEFLTV